ncbi:MAG: hypothetical protein HOP18_05760 [Deltaproteobacteria bacterium]|nr:hypothetical protein [Deltaproteobacteria bacterium]
MNKQYVFGMPRGRYYLSRSFRFFRTVAIVLAVCSLASNSVLAKDKNRNGGDEDEDPATVITVKDFRFKFEVNATALDAGIQVFIDADGWRELEILDPQGKRIFRSTAQGSIKEIGGGTELFLESDEPPLSEVPFSEQFELFPEGEYRFRGKGTGGEIIVGKTTLTHNIPAGPRLVSPLQGGPLQDPNNTVIVWEPVPPPNGSPIIGYQVLVVNANTGFVGLPKVTLDVMMPATATRMVVPPGFLLRDTEYEWEVLAIEAGGNQTLSTSFFRTAK